MQPGVRRFLLACLRPFLSGLLLAALAALAPVGPAMAGEVAAEGSVAPWQRLPAGGAEPGSWQDPAGFRDPTEFELTLRETDDGALWRGLYFRVGDRLQIGAEGGIDFGSGGLRAIIALKLEF